MNESSGPSGRSRGAFVSTSNNGRCGLESQSTLRLLGRPVDPNYETLGFAGLSLRAMEMRRECVCLAGWLARGMGLMLGAGRLGGDDTR
jgi:hypothetical protein